MPSEKSVSPRVPWRAALLGLVAGGLGQLYSGRPFRAIVIHLLAWCAVFLGVSAFFIPLKPWNVIVPLALLLGSVLVFLGDAVRCARMAGQEYRLKPYNQWYVYLLLVALAGVEQQALTSFLRTRFAQAVKNVAGSMLPTLMPGDRIVVSKRAYTKRTPQRGDVITFRYPRNPSVMFVKRVIAVGGDVVRIRNKKVYLNGQPLFEPYAQFQSRGEDLPARDDFPPSGAVLETPLASALDSAWKHEIPAFTRTDGLHIPPDCVFVLGDNRDDSWDSRFYGFVPRANVLGRVRTIYFSWDAKAHRVRWGRLGEIIK
jgi:signal peptidase I